MFIGLLLFIHTSTHPYRSFIHAFFIFSWNQIADDWTGVLLFSFTKKEIMWIWFCFLFSIRLNNWSGSGEKCDLLHWKSGRAYKNGILWTLIESAWFTIVGKCVDGSNQIIRKWVWIDTVVWPSCSGVCVCACVFCLVAGAKGWCLDDWMAVRHLILHFLLYI